MRLLHRAADALLSRLVPSDTAHAACISCNPVSGCSVRIEYKTDSAACRTYARCRYSGSGCPDGGWVGSWKLCGNYC